MCWLIRRMEELSNRSPVSIGLLDSQLILPLRKIGHWFTDSGQGSQCQPSTLVWSTFGYSVHWRWTPDRYGQLIMWMAHFVKWTTSYFFLPLIVPFLCQSSHFTWSRTLLTKSVDLIQVSLADATVSLPRYEFAIHNFVAMCGVWETVRSGSALFGICFCILGFGSFCVILS